MVARFSIICHFGVYRPAPETSSTTTTDRAIGSIVLGGFKENVGVVIQSEKGCLEDDSHGSRNHLCDLSCVVEF